MGKRTADAELTLTHAIRQNDELRARKGRARLDSVGRLADSDKQVEFLQKQVEIAKKQDADDAAAAHAERLKAVQADAVASRQAEKLAAQIDSAVNDLVAQFSKLANLIEPRFERAKQSLFHAHGIQDLIHRVEVNRRWLGGAGTVGEDLQHALAEQQDLNREYTLAVSDMHVSAGSLQSLHLTSPAAADVVENILKRIRTAWSKEPIPTTRSLADVHADATTQLERHVETLKSLEPK